VTLVDREFEVCPAQQVLLDPLDPSVVRVRADSLEYQDQSVSSIRLLHMSVFHLV